MYPFEDISDRLVLDGGSLARKILETDHKQEALEKCAYINLYPYSGKGTAKTSNYSVVLEQIQQKNTGGIAENRLEIIRSALDNGISVLTVKEIAVALAKKFSLDPDEQPFMTVSGVNYRSYTYSNTAKIYYYKHPGAPISYKNLAAALGFPVDNLD